MEGMGIRRWTEQLQEGSKGWARITSREVL